MPANVFGTLTLIAKEREQPFGNFNLIMKYTSSPAFFRNWKLLYRIGLARPIVKVPEKRGLV